MDKFTKIYKEIISEAQTEIINPNIEKAIAMLEDVKDGYVIPAEAKKKLAEIILLLNPAKGEGENGKFEELYSFENYSIRICKDAGEDNYYFIIDDGGADDDMDSMGRWVSYENAVEFENEEGMWETREECLEQALDTCESVWEDFDFSKFVKQ